MSGISSSLNYLLASNFTQMGPLPTAAQNQQQSFTNDVRAALGNLKPGTPVSTRTNYTVGNNGQLIAGATAITVGDATDESNQPSSQRYRQQQGPALSFADLTKPKPKLSPEEEMLLFNAETLEDEEGSRTSYVLPDGAEDENGEPVQMEVFTPNANAQSKPTLAQQLQQRVSHLYAQVNDIVYTSAPAVTFAA